MRKCYDRILSNSKDVIISVIRLLEQTLKMQAVAAFAACGRLVAATGRKFCCDRSQFCVKSRDYNLLIVFGLYFKNILVLFYAS